MRATFTKESKRHEENERRAEQNMQTVEMLLKMVKECKSCDEKFFPNPAEMEVCVNCIHGTIKY